ncbi:uncharacterized protein B0I36DRAFT_333553 [Microdochium trichocladiopsis]|uniref:Uncharacterized protein n=1 Tax=Microdochium trichocladiopsis TaxID=1682393 RepID=A0A9P8XVM1_9PEZI|nr:uncharacterized protein B0I36DRAFT_333553 [Microdochium trichocladiopsis]KAH7020974.1 hypothetical protein B0I36DRAFT_333553 [Microdochium trichocladiopsis]
MGISLTHALRGTASPSLWAACLSLLRGQQARDSETMAQTPDPLNDCRFQLNAVPRPCLCNPPLLHPGSADPGTTHLHGEAEI